MQFSDPAFIIELQLLESFLGGRQYEDTLCVQYMKVIACCTNSLQHTPQPRLAIRRPETATAEAYNMAHLQYYNYPGYGERAVETYKYSQAVRVGDRIECSGQGRCHLRTKLH